MTMPLDNYNNSVCDFTKLYNLVHISIYCRSGNIREVLIFANFARKTSSRIQESRENYYYYNSGTKEK